MIVKENITIYKCEFCGKELKRKYAMTKHEETCKNNPENYKKCLSNCKYLDKLEKSFKCTKLDKLMYPYSIEKSNALETYPETFEGQEPMPKDCEHFNNDILGFN